jgi:hypothetical protein
METLEIKGSGIISIMEYVETIYGPAGYAKWLSALSLEARELVSGSVFLSSWYSGHPAVFELREKVCEVFFDGDPQAARAIGRFAADSGLRGIYRTLVKLGSVEWVTSRAPIVASRYFRPIIIQPLVKERHYFLVRMEGVHTKSEPLEASLCGFNKRAIEISGGKDVVVTCPSSVARGDPYIDFECTWKE